MPSVLLLASHPIRALSKAPQHSLYQDNQNKEKHDFFGHVTQLPSHETIHVGVI